jgi:hypothetical protein
VPQRSNNLSASMKLGGRRIRLESHFVLQEPPLGTCWISFQRAACKDQQPALGLKWFSAFLFLTLREARQKTSRVRDTCSVTPNHREMLGAPDARSFRAALGKRPESYFLRTSKKSMTALHIPS